MERMSKIRTTYIYDDETDTAELTELEEVGGVEEEYKELENELEYVRTIKDSAEKTLKEVREENKKLKEELKKDDREVQVDVDKELLKANDYLIKENKKLKEEKEKSDSIINKKIIDLHNQVVELLEENKKLKECNSNLMKEVKLCYKELEK